MAKPSGAERRKFFKDSVELRRYIKTVCGNTVLLAFSRGKDALGAWLALRADGFKVIPFHMEGPPGMKFIDRSIAYYEAFFGCRIERYLHPNFYRMLDNALMQPPERVRLLADATLYRRITYDHVADDLRERFDLPDAYLATGVRAVDSPLRMMAVRKHGPIHHGRQSFMAVYDWNKAKLVEELRSSGVRLPVDYKMWGRTFDGIDMRFLVPLKAKYPEDYATLLKWFPMAGLDILRREFAAQKGRVVTWPSM